MTQLFVIVIDSRWRSLGQVQGQLQSSKGQEYFRREKRKGVNDAGYEDLNQFGGFARVFNYKNN